MAVQQKGHTPKEWVVPVPPNNALADNKDIIELRNEKGKLYRVYSEAKIAEFRAAFEKQLVAEKKNYDNGVRHREKQKIIAQQDKLAIKSSAAQGRPVAAPTRRRLSCQRAPGAAVNTVGAIAANAG